MAGVLAAEDGARLGHHLLDEAVPDLGPDAGPALLGDHLGDDPRADAVVEHGGSRVLVEQGGRHQRRGQRSGDGFGALVHQEDAVGVAVEGEPDVGAGLEHHSPELDQVLRLDGVGRMVGEVAVELGVEDLDLERQSLEHLRGHQPAHAVGRVGHHLQRAQDGGVDEGADVVGVGVEDRAVLERAEGGGIGFGRAAVPPTRRAAPRPWPGSRPVRCPARWVGRPTGTASGRCTGPGCGRR